MNEAKILSRLPAIDELLRNELLQELTKACPHVHLVKWAREAVEHCRRQVLDGRSIDPETLESTIVARILDSYRVDQTGSMQHVINATGVLLHTNLGRAPMAPLAVERMREVAAYANLEMELGSGKRSRRGRRATDLLAELTGAEDAVVVNNCAAATMLVLQTVAADQEVIVSRGQLVEIGGGFRLPEVFTAAGAVLREVGTTNRTYLHDYEGALGEKTGAIIRVHRSNFTQSGFVAEPTIGELAALRKLTEAVLIDDLGSGCVIDLSALGIQEPTVMESVSSGADLCLFSGDKLFGGPQCGIVVGRKRWIDPLRANPMMRALRPDKLTLAALETTTEIHLSGKAFQQLPFYQMLARDPCDIRADCECIVSKLVGACDFETTVVECASRVGGGSLPHVELPSFGLAIQSGSSETLASVLRKGAPAVLCRQVDDQLLLDLRTVAECEIQDLTRRLGELSASAARTNNHATDEA